MGTWLPARNLPGSRAATSLGTHSEPPARYWGCNFHKLLVLFEHIHYRRLCHRERHQDSEGACLWRQLCEVHHKRRFTTSNSSLTLRMRSDHNHWAKNSLQATKSGELLIHFLGNEATEFLHAHRICRWMKKQFQSSRNNHSVLCCRVHWITI